MGVLAVHPGAELYGSDRVFLASVSAFAQEHDVHVLVPNDGPLVRLLEEVARVRVTVRPFAVLRRVEFRGIGLLRTLYRTTRDLVGAYRFLRRARPEAVYVSTIIAPLWLAAARWSRVPVVVHVHENESGLSRAQSRLLLAPLLLAQHLVANSGATAEWLTDAFARTRGKVSVVYNGVPSPPATPETERARDPSEPYQLVVVGRLAERKGQDIAIRALEQLHNRGLSVSLTLVGDVYPGYESYAVGLKELASELGVSRSVHFTGFVADPSSHFAAADVVLVPSRIEPFGNVAVEAQLRRRCVVASAVQGLAEIVLDESTGLLVAPGDPSELAHAVERLLRNPGLAGRLATAGWERATALFGEDRYARDIARVLSALSTG